MRSTRRPFSGEADMPAMIDLARLAPAENLHLLDLPYRLSSWALDWPENVGLWLDARGDLLAWAVLQSPFWTIDLACHPDAPPQLFLEVGFRPLQEVLVYRKDYWAGRKPLCVRPV